MVQYYSSFNKPTICIPNGIDIDKVPILKTTGNNNNIIKFFFIGTPGLPWHGVDLIEKIAEKLPEYEFHIVGLNGKSRLKNVFYYGFMSYNEYVKILKECHICIGTLALHRKNSKEASPLKVREYLAHGFPTIIGYKDTAFLEQKPDFILEIDLSDENVSDEVIYKIKEFALKNKNRVVNHEEVRNFIDINVLEQKKVEFIKKLI